MLLQSILLLRVHYMIEILICVAFSPPNCTSLQAMRTWTGTSHISYNICIKILNHFRIINVLDRNAWLEWQTLRLTNTMLIVLLSISMVEISIHESADSLLLVKFLFFIIFANLYIKLWIFRTKKWHLAYFQLFKNWY